MATAPPAPSPDSYARALHTLSITCLVLCPILILLPPRKLDLYTACLGTTTLLSANSLHKERYNGLGIMGRLAGQQQVQPRQLVTPVPAAQQTRRVDIGSSSGSALPTDRAREFSQRFREERKRGMSDSELAARRQAERGLGDKLWFGDEDREGWKEKRDREVKEKFDEGKGIGDVIMDQIWEVWTWGKSEQKKDE